MDDRELALRAYLNMMNALALNTYRPRRCDFCGRPLQTVMYRHHACDAVKKIDWGVRL